MELYRKTEVVATSPPPSIAAPPPPGAATPSFIAATYEDHL